MKHLLTAVLLLILASGSAQTKYFKPTGIIDRTKELAGKSTWTSLSDRERINGYTRIGDSIFGGEISCNVRALNNIDVRSFKVLPGTKYAKDTNHVYYPVEVYCVDYVDCGVCSYAKIILENADPSTFLYLGKDYASDGKLVFFRGKLIQGADAATFKVIDGPEFFYFATDRNNVYKRDNVFKDADPATFYYNKDDPRNKDRPGFSHLCIFGDKNNEWEYIGSDQN